MNFARAVLGIPVNEITLEKNGASAVILAKESTKTPTDSGIKRAASIANSDLRIFGNRQHVHIEEWQLHLHLEMNQQISLLKS